MEGAVEYEALYNDQAEKIANERGCVIIYPEANQLQIDIDSEQAFKLFLKRSRELREFGVPFTFLVSESRSGRPHCHIRITVDGKEFSEPERVAWQVMFGSDPIREGLNTMRYIAGIKAPSRLFVPKVSAGAVPAPPPPPDDDLPDWAL